MSAYPRRSHRIFFSVVVGVEIKSSCGVWGPASFGNGSVCENEWLKEVIIESYIYFNISFNLLLAGMFFSPRRGLQLPAQRNNILVASTAMREKRPGRS
jgi:hypothetical protein